MFYCSLFVDAVQRIRGLEKHGHAVGGANNSPVGCYLVRGSQLVGMSTGRTTAKKLFVSCRQRKIPPGYYLPALSFGTKKRSMQAFSSVSSFTFLSMPPA